MLACVYRNLAPFAVEQLRKMLRLRRQMWRTPARIGGGQRANYSGLRNIPWPASTSAKRSLISTCSVIQAGAPLCASGAARIGVRSASTATSTSSMSVRRFIGAIDQGTTSSRFMLFDEGGCPVASAQKEHKQVFPASAWVEHDPEEIWTRVQEVVATCLSKAGVQPSQLAGVGITNQRETLVVWNKQTGKPYHNALVWQDQRGATLCKELTDMVEGGVDALKHKTGLPIVPYFSASKLAWALANVPGLKADAKAGKALFGTIDSFLLYRLTNGAMHATDVSNASRTLLFNIHTMAWDDDLLDLFGIPRAMLPTVLPSSTTAFGKCNGGALAGVAIGGILGDQQSALFGQTCFEPGDAKNTYGTGTFMLMNTGNNVVASKHGLLSTVAYQIGDQAPVYALEGSVAVAGAVVTWLRDNLQLIKQASETEESMSSVPDAGGCVFVPAFNGLFAPHWRSDARGTIVGLSGNTDRRHIVRAALESVAFQSKELLDAMTADRAHSYGSTSSSRTPRGASSAAAGSGAHGQTLCVDGGMTANSTLMQFQADIIGQPVVKPVVHETTALGAAYAAGLSVGFWKDTDELKQHWNVEKTWNPSMDRNRAAELYGQWGKAVQRSLGWAQAAR